MCAGLVQKLALGRLHFETVAQLQAPSPPDLQRLAEHIDWLEKASPQAGRFGPAKPSQVCSTSSKTRSSCASNGDKTIHGMFFLLTLRELYETASRTIRLLTPRTPLSSCVRETGTRSVISLRLDLSLIPSIRGPMVRSVCCQYCFGVANMCQ